MYQKNIVAVLFVFSFTFFGVAQETLTLSTESSLTINGTSTVHEWEVTANTLEGSARVMNTSITEIDFKVVVADIKSERGATMDKKMHKALANNTHPKITFLLNEIKDQTTLVGTLNIAGVAHEVEMIGVIESSNDIVYIIGKYKIALQDYNITPPTAMFGQVIVGDEVIVNFHLVFKK